MTLWIGFAVLTAAVLVTLLRPLLRPADDPSGYPPADLSVYRDQLKELDAERARGLIPEADVATAKLEIERRLLAAADRETAPVSSLSSRLASTAGLGVAVAIPPLAIALYLLLGSPGMPDYPLSARSQSPVDTAGVSELIGRVEARLREHPEDGAGWDVIAPVYLKQGRHADAADAFARAARLLGETPRRLAGHAEAAILAHDGVVTEPARASYAKLLKQHPERPEPRFWLAVAKEQDGQLAEALSDYEALLRDADANAPWRAAVVERRDSVRARLSPQQKDGAQSAPVARGPTGEDMAAAERLTPEARTEFINQMVAGLAERLSKDGSDLAGWQRLIRAYSVLGRSDDARGALGEARRNFSDKPQSLEQLEALAKSLGLSS